MEQLDTSPSADHERLLTASEVAEWLGVRIGTLYTWRHTHRGPRSLTLHGGVRYRPSDIQDWLERGARRGER
jgi:predicted DNA-binding transcriptional regulator AlpA